MAGKRIVIVADTASLFQGGEAAMPVRFFQYFRKAGAQPTLFCHARSTEDLRRVLTEDELASVVFFEDTLPQKTIWRIGKALPQRLQEVFSYAAIRMLTERRQRAEICRRIRRGELDFVYQPVPISPKVISMIARVGVPTFFGPLNGNIEYPPALRKETSKIVEMIVRAGRIIAEPLHYVFRAKRLAAGLFVCNARTLHALPIATREVPKFRTYDATIEADRWRRVERKCKIDANHFIYVGRLVDWKAVDIAIDAVQRLDGARLTIVGDGPDRERLENLAGKGGKVTFRGFLNHDELMLLYEDVSAQLLPSLREAGGNVCLEGLAASVPVIATNWGGASDIIRNGVDGFLVEPISRDHLVEGFVSAMSEIMRKPGLGLEMGANGRKRALTEFDWAQKARDYLSVFEESVARTGAKADEIRNAHSTTAWA
jgi:glycosyltransferase involved in cell wall biosynthesis